MLILLMVLMVLMVLMMLVVMVMKTNLSADFNAGTTFDVVVG